jgi:hypothetical protein
MQRLLYFPQCMDCCSENGLDWLKQALTNFRNISLHFALHFVQCKIYCNIKAQQSQIIMTLLNANDPTM